MSALADLLYEDPKIPNQEFVCVSFVSPEEILKNKDLYMFEKFLNNWDLNKSMEKYREFLAFASFKYKVDSEALDKDFKSFVTNEQEKFSNYNVSDDFKNFVEAHGDNISKQFLTENKFQTDTRGIKVRGTYSTQEEAEIRSRLLRELDPNHDVYVGQVGLWMPWHPNAYKTNRVEYLETELNQLMHEKEKNEIKAKEEFETRVKSAKQTAIDENIKIAAESGNKLSQNINEQGELVGVNNDSDLRVAVADIEKELFDRTNVRTKESDEKLKES